MATCGLRLRRALVSFSLSRHYVASQPTAAPRPLSHLSTIIRSCSHLQKISSACCSVQVRGFSEGRSWKLYKEGDEITEDTVLFEGCDFNHWLITVDFPKDPKPTPEEMVATYEKICAQGLNISIEEAKKKIYACSTTTYQGFQAIMTEAESEKFKDVPGVVFVLPDSYIDPVNKEYGGDKYENGVIFPRPPPYIAQREQRRNQRFDRPRNYQNYNQNQNHNQNQNQNQNPQYNQPRPMQGEGRSFIPPNFSQQDPSRRDHGPPHNYTPQQQYNPQGQPPQGRGWNQNNYNQAPPPSFDQQSQTGFPYNQNNYGSSSQPGFDRNNSNFSSGGYSNYQGEKQHQPGPPQQWQNGNYRGGQ